MSFRPPGWSLAYAAMAVAWALGATASFSQPGETEAQVMQLRREQVLAEWRSRSVSYGFDAFTILVPMVDAESGEETSVPVTHIRYDERVFFDYDSYQLQSLALEAIRDLSTFLTSQPTVRSVVVVGHTDARGSEDYNGRLSENRALAVLRQLIDDGVPLPTLSAVAMGEAQPIAPNTTELGQGRNRRVEFFISDHPEAALEAIQQTRVDPCFLLDTLTDTTVCPDVSVRVPVLVEVGGQVQERGEINIDTERGDLEGTPIARPQLAPGPADRPIFGLPTP